MRSTMKIAARLVLGVVVAGAAACSAGTTGPSGGTEAPDAPGAPLTILGTYRLAVVNGQSLPALLWHDDTAGDMDAEMYIESGSIVLRPDSTFHNTMVTSLMIEGVGDQLSTSINEGLYSYRHTPGHDAGEGVIFLSGYNGGMDTLLVSAADGTILSRSMIPGAVGEPDMEVVKLYTR